MSPAPCVIFLVTASINSLIIATHNHTACITYLLRLNDRFFIFDAFIASVSEKCRLYDRCRGTALIMWRHESSVTSCVVFDHQLRHRDLTQTRREQQRCASFIIWHVIVSSTSCFSVPIHDNLNILLWQCCWLCGTGVCICHISLPVREEWHFY